MLKARPHDLETGKYHAKSYMVNCVNKISVALVKLDLFMQHEKCKKELISCGFIPLTMGK